MRLTSLDIMMRVVSVTKFERPERLGGSTMAHDDVFRVLALGDTNLADQSWKDAVERFAGVDPRIVSVAQLSALVALGAGESSFGAAVDTAIGAGSTVEEIVGVMCALAPIVGTARLAVAASQLGPALGIDADDMFEPGSSPQVRM
jgi:alkylhydroperoxidase/carboxymuconolactone decarboxylase family protein YurZ